MRCKQPTNKVVALGIDFIRTSLVCYIRVIDCMSSEFRFWSTYYTDYVKVDS